MPIEIKELHIKAVITAPKENSPQSRTFSFQDQDFQKLKKEILDECLEKVFRKLEEKQER